MKQRKKGAALVEFALAFVILIPLVAGAFQYSIGFLQALRLEAAVRAAALYGSQLPYLSSTETPDSGFLIAVQNMALYGKPEDTGKPLIPTLRPEHVAVQVSLVAGVPRTVSVSIRGFTLVLPTGNRLLDGKPASSFPFRGRFEPR